MARRDKQQSLYGFFKSLEIASQNVEDLKQPHFDFAQ